MPRLMKPYRHIPVISILSTKKPIETNYDQFLEWEREERELFETKLLKIKQHEVDDEDNEIQEDDKEEVIRVENTSVKKKQSVVSTTFNSALPDYMLKMISAFEEPTEALVSLPASKLPIIAVVGRPNTGKSTLVNKLTNSYKVIFSSTDKQ
jgi:GTP-binding protein EngB required for normal cell division